MTVFSRTSEGVDQPGLAFDRSTATLHAVGALPVDDAFSTPVGVAELPTGAVSDSDVRVWNSIGHAITTVAEDGYLHVSTQRMTSRWIYSRAPSGEWRMFDLGRVGQPRLVADGGELHVFAARPVAPEEEYRRHVVHYRFDVRDWEVTESPLPFDEGLWFVDGAAADPSGAFHIVLSQNEHSVLYATDAEGDWTIHELMRSSSFREWTYPSLTVGPEGRVWIAYVDVPSERLMVLSDSRD